MARRNLSADEIKWILTVDAQGVQGEIQKLSSVINDLTKKNESLKDTIKRTEKELKNNERELAKLEKTGATTSNRYKNLTTIIDSQRESINGYTKIIKDNTKAIDAQNKKINETIRTMKLEEMTMNQLKKRAKELQSQLDRTSESLSPESYAKLDKELKSVHGRMNQLKQSSKELNETSGKTPSILRGGLMVLAGNLMTKALGKIKELVSAAKEFVREGKEMAISADGVTHAFKQLNAPGLLSNLRKSTKDTVNDFELMKTAVQAKDFRIPFQDLGKYLEFAQLKAQQTGKSVEYMTESIVTGLGRRSVKILDNLGITSAEIAENMKKTGDFTSAVAAIVDKQLASAGERYVSAADRVQQKTVLLENAKLKLGQRVLWLQESYDKMVSYLAKDTINALSTANEKYEEQLEKVVELETEMPDLLRQYEELSSKTNLSKEEQEKLKVVIGQITDMVPGVITAWDSYGNAISISTDKVNQFIESQKALLSYMNRDAIKEAEKNITQYKERLDELQVQYDQGGVTRFEGGNSMFQAPKPVIDNRPETLKQIEEDLAKYGNLLKGAELSLDELQGKRLEAYVNESKERKKFTAMTKEELDAWIKNEKNAASEYMKIAKEVYDFRFAGTPTTTPTGPGKSTENKTKPDQLKPIDNQLQAEINLLKKRRLEGEIIEADYNKRVEELTIASYHKKLEITDLEADQRISIQGQLYDALLKQQNSADAEMLKALQAEQDKQLQMIESARQLKLEKLQEEETDRQLYALRAAEIESSAAESRLAIIRIFEKTLQDAEFQNGENRTKAVEANAKKIVAEEEKSLKTRDQLQRRFLKTSADFERLYNIKNWEQRRDEELAILERYRKENLMSEETYQIAINAVDKKYRDEKLKARHQAGIATMQEEYNAELENLTSLHEQKMLSEEEYEQAVFRMRMKYAAKYAEQSLDYIGKTSEVVSNLMSAETDNVEARYNAEIAAAGDNAEEVERLENEKAKKKLEIEKKYADVQFAITAAQIIASTAMAVMQALAQLGPIAGAIVGAFVGATGIAQLLAANAQRKKVKSMTLAGGGDSSESSSRGQITMKEGFAEGGYNTDYSAGGYTRDGAKYETAGWLPVHSGEYVVASDEMARPDVVEKVRSIERIRRRRTSKNRYSEGLADGGHNTTERSNANTTAAVKAEQKTMENLSKVVQRLLDGDITVNYGITEMEAKQRRKQEVESIFTQTS